MNEEKLRLLVFLTLSTDAEIDRFIDLVRGGKTPESAIEILRKEREDQKKNASAPFSC